MKKYTDSYSVSHRHFFWLLGTNFLTVLGLILITVGPASGAETKSDKATVARILSEIQKSNGDLFWFDELNRYRTNSLNRSYYLSHAGDYKFYPPLNHGSKPKTQSAKSASHWMEEEPGIMRIYKEMGGYPNAPMNWDLYTKASIEYFEITKPVFTALDYSPGHYFFKNFTDEIEENPQGTFKKTVVQQWTEDIRGGLFETYHINKFLYVVQGTQPSFRPTKYEDESVLKQSLENSFKDRINEVFNLLTVIDEDMAGWKPRTKKYFIKKGDTEIVVLAKALLALETQSATPKNKHNSLEFIQRIIAFRAAEHMYEYDNTPALLKRGHGRKLIQDVHAYMVLNENSSYPNDRYIDGTQVAKLASKFMNQWNNLPKKYAWALEAAKDEMPYFAGLIDFAYFSNYFKSSKNSVGECRAILMNIESTRKGD